MADVFVMYSTFANKAEALLVARELVEKRLVACVNVHEGMTSVYRWENRLEEAQEVALTAKTTSANLKKAIDEVKRLHSHKVPCIIACPIEAGFLPYIQWIRDEVS